MSKVKREESSRTFEPVQPGSAALRGTRRVPAEKKKNYLQKHEKKKHEKKKKKTMSGPCSMMIYI